MPIDNNNYFLISLIFLTLLALINAIINTYVITQRIVLTTF
jgi:hypothetical protein